MKAAFSNPVPIGELCEVIAGQSPKGAALNTTGNGVAFYQGKKDFGDRYILPPVKWTSQVTKTAIAGDILMSVRAPVGPINEAVETICIGRGLAAIRPLNDIEKDYLWYALLWLQPEIIGHAGAVFSSINKNGIKALKIPLPPLEEQKQIVAILDEAFAGLDRARAHTEANLQNARDLFESHVSNMFEKLEKNSGSLVSMRDVCSSLHQGLNTAGQKIKFFETGYPIIQTRNIKNNRVDVTEKIKFMSQVDWDKYKEKYCPKRGDVFFTNIGTIGKTAVLTEDASYLVHWNIFKISPIPELVLSDFLKFRLDFLTTTGFFEKKQKGGTVNFVTKKMIEKVTIPSLSISEQTSFVKEVNEIIEKTNYAKVIYQTKLADLDELRQSLLQKAFAGELT